MTNTEHSKLSKATHFVSTIQSFVYGLREFPLISPSDDRLDDDDVSYDKNDLIGINVDRMSEEIDSYSSIRPFVRIHICRKDTGSYISNIPLEKEIHYGLDDYSQPRKMFQAPIAVTSLSNKSLISKGMNRSASQTMSQWNDRIIFQEGYDQFVKAKSGLVLFEVLDYWPAQSLIGKTSNSKKKLRYIAWGFLRPHRHQENFNVNSNRNKVPDEGDEGSKNWETMKTCKLKLYRYKHDSYFLQQRSRQLGIWNKTLVPRVYLQYLRKKWDTINASLHVAIGPVPCPAPVGDKTIIQPRGPKDKIEEERRIGNTSTQNLSQRYHDKISLRKRSPDEKCVTPDILLYRFRSGNRGISTLAFSQSGDILAVAAIHEEYDTMYPLTLYNVIEGKKVYSFAPGHYGKILDLAWSEEDEFLASASTDGTISVHRIISLKIESESDNCYRPQQNMEEINEAEEKIGNKSNFKNVTIFTFCPPSYPCCVAFLPKNANDQTYNGKQTCHFPMLISGSSDNAITMWNIEKEESEGELGGSCSNKHKASVTAVSIDRKNKRIYSGDASGCIMIWKPIIEFPRKGEDYEILHCLDGLKGLRGKSIKEIGIHQYMHTQDDQDYEEPKKKHLFITTNDKISHIFLYDFSSRTIVPESKKIKEMKLTSAVCSPDGGRLIMAGSISGRLHFMDALTRVKRKSNLDDTVFPAYISKMEWNERQHMMAICFLGENTTALVYGVRVLS